MASCLAVLRVPSILPHPHEDALLGMGGTLARPVCSPPCTDPHLLFLPQHRSTVASCMHRQETVDCLKKFNARRKLKVTGPHPAHGPKVGLSFI